MIIDLKRLITKILERLSSHSSSIELLGRVDEAMQEEIGGIKLQNILWQGGAYMNAQQTFTLSESVSAQTNGIVFVWSHYDNSTSTAHNYEWVSIFVPKSLVALHSNTGHRMSFLTDVGVLVSKYVYITDTTIRGHEKNSQQLTSNGRAIDNRKAVLRYVIGV